MLILIALIVIGFCPSLDFGTWTYKAKLINGFYKENIGDVGGHVGSSYKNLEFFRFLRGSNGEFPPKNFNFPPPLKTV